jgi:hypothetical protein
MGADARGYSWPAFAAGNEVATRHGAFSERRVAPIAAQLAQGLLAVRPDLSDFPEALGAWSRAEARTLLLHGWLDDVGWFDDDGRERPALRFVVSFERLAADMRARLGLDPVSEAALARERAEAARQVVDIAAIQERGRRALETRAR